jgi:uncharacterized protein (TIGR03083 family)
MTMTSQIEVGTISPIDHREAMALATVEAGRLCDVLDRLVETDWSLPTDCDGWDVKSLLSHGLGSMEANARTRHFIGQYVGALRAAKRSGRTMIDEMTAAQVRRHAQLSSTEIRSQIHAIALEAVRGRRRMPALLRAVAITPGAPFEGKWKLGYLVDTIMNRDYWMHRVDLTRATGTQLVVTGDHDGRIVADVVAEWARAHNAPFTLVLDGPAGATFTQGRGGQELRLDAIEFCRVLSGRGQGQGLLKHQIPF